MSSPVLPPSWATLLDEIEAALKITLGQIRDLPPSPALVDFARLTAAPAERLNYARSVEATVALASAADLELFRSEEALRDWLAGVPGSNSSPSM